MVWQCFAAEKRSNVGELQHLCKVKWDKIPPELYIRYIRLFVKYLALLHQTEFMDVNCLPILGVWTWLLQKSDENENCQLSHWKNIHLENHYLYLLCEIFT